jgi:hypothetical protein
MNDLFGSGGLIDAASTLDFETKASEFEEKIDKENDSLKTYFCNNLKPRLLEFVFKLSRKTNGFKNWTNNNAESMNNILKLSLDWKPKRNVCHNKSPFHGLSNPLHGTGNYNPTQNERRVYHIPDSIWRCKTKEKNEIFDQFLMDKKRLIKMKYVEAKNGKYTVINKVNGVAKKPGQRKRSLNKRTRKP